MARFHPPRCRKGATFGERQVFERLRQLDDAWVVLHSLTFVWDSRRGARMGESDFILLHPVNGMLVLEVKDAQYRVEARTWYRTAKSGGEIRDSSPFLQAEQNKYKITALLRDAGVSRVPIGHCVLFTAGRPTGALGPDAPDAIVLSLPALDEAAERIDRVVAHWQAGSWKFKADFELALGTLSPEARIGPSLDYDIDVSLGELHRLTDAQIKLTSRQLEIVRATTDSPASLILGAAGTGKTLVAYEYARQLSAQGRVVALLGVPPVLRLLTRRKLAAGGVAAGDAFDVLRSLYSPAELEPYEGGTAWEIACEIADAVPHRLETLIVDEAQTFDPELLEVLQELLVAGGQTVLLADPYQRDTTGMWRPPGHYKEHWLTENCRNTLPIARLVSRLSGGQPPVEGVAGRSPRIQEMTAPLAYDDVAEIVAAELRTVETSNVVILTRTTGAANRMLDALRRRKIAVTRGLKESAVAICTVDEFRGCEAHAVLYLAEPAPGADLRTIDYLATSRACAYLRVLGDPAEWAECQYLFDVDGVPDADRR